LSGVPPFAGFWSKDEILLYVFANNRGLYVVGLVTALLTAFYMTRQVIMVFFGEAKWNDHSEEHGAHGDFVPHESPKIMLFPLVVLAVLSVGGGLLQLPFTKDLHFLEKWLEPIVEHGEAHISGSWAYDNKYLLMLVAIVVALGGIALAVGVYGKKKLPAIEPQILANAWNYDKGVSAFMGGPGRQSFEGVAWADAHVIDGAVRGTGSVVRQSSGLVRKIQSGYVRVYAAAIVIGVLAMLAWFMWRGVA